MGLGSPSLANEFDRNPNAYFDEYCQELGEAPIDKPYEFCSFIKQANGEEKKIMEKLQKRAEKNDLADLHEEMHGKPNTPMVTHDDLPYEGDDELPDVPKKKGKK